MAIYHFSMQIIGRSQGRSAVAAAAYRAGQRLQDERYGKTYDYTKKNVSERAIFLPDHAPRWMANREKLWNAVEQAEKRKDSQLCREINVALPRELNVQQQQKLLADFVKEQFVQLGMIADVCIHRDHPENPHAHIMLTMRDVTPEGFGKKNTSWNPSFFKGKGQVNGSANADNCVKWREAWANYANQALLDARINERIDHRSYKDQGKELEPTIHEGPHVRAMEKRGIQTEKGDINRAVREYNQTVVSLQAYRLKKIDNQLEKQKAHCSDLLDELNGKATQIKQLTKQLEPVKIVAELEKRREEYLKQIQALEPKTLWEKVRNVNKNEIFTLQRQVKDVEKSLTNFNITFSPSEVRAMEEELLSLKEQYKKVSTDFDTIETGMNSLYREKARLETHIEHSMLDMTYSAIASAAIRQMNETEYEKELLARRNALRRRKAQGYDR